MAKIGQRRFRVEVERRLLDVRGVMDLLGFKHRQQVWKRVNAGQLPEPLVSYDRSHSLWDLDEIESFKPDTTKE